MGGGLFGWLEGSPRKWPDVEPGRLPSGLRPWQSGESGINHTPCRQLGSSPVLLGLDARAPGGPHGASCLPGLRSLGLVLHTRSWLAGGCCLCVVRVVTVIQPPATWPQRLARMLVTTPWARAGAPKCVKVAVLGLRWRSGCAPSLEPSVSSQQAPRGPRGQPARRPSGPLRPLVLGMDATLGSTLQTGCHQPCPPSCLQQAPKLVAFALDIS